MIDNGDAGIRERAKWQTMERVILFDCDAARGAWAPTCCGCACIGCGPAAVFDRGGGGEGVLFVFFV